MYCSLVLITPIQQLKRPKHIVYSEFDDFTLVSVAQLRNIGLKTRFFEGKFILHLAATYSNLRAIKPSHSV